MPLTAPKTVASAAERAIFARGRVRGLLARSKIEEVEIEEVERSQDDAKRCRRKTSDISRCEGTAGADCRGCLCLERGEGLASLPDFSVPDCLN